MKNAKIKVKIEFEDTDEKVSLNPKKIEDGFYEIVFSQDVTNIIDHSEQAILKANYEAIRDAVSDFLSDYSKKKL